MKDGRLTRLEEMSLGRVGDVSHRVLSMEVENREKVSIDRKKLGNLAEMSIDRKKLGESVNRY